MDNEVTKNLIGRMCEFERDSSFPDERAKAIKMLVLDVDGVLTDGGLYYGDEGLAIKRFDVQDGLGIKLAQRAGIEVVIISGMESPALMFRAKDLAITECHAGIFRKLPKLEEIMAARGISWTELAYVGDDIIDLPILHRAGLALAVKNAQPEIRAAVHYVAPLCGGAGGVRWCIRHILLAQGHMSAILADFL